MPKYAAPEFRAMGEKCRDARDPGNICRSCDLDGTTLEERVIGMLIAIMLDNLRAGGPGRFAIRATQNGFGSALQIWTSRRAELPEKDFGVSTRISRHITWTSRQRDFALGDVRQHQIAHA